MLNRRSELKIVNAQTPNWMSRQSEGREIRDELFQWPEIKSWGRRDLLACCEFFFTKLSLKFLAVSLAANTSVHHVCHAERILTVKNP
jgi:hypothetical protein